MKLREIKSIIASGTLLIGTLAINVDPSSAQRDNKYFCGNIEDVPTTVGITAIGKEIPVIRWKIDWNEEYTPLVRCRIVSKRFQTAYRHGLLEYITSGIINNQNVICAAKNFGGPCNKLLVTLRNNDNPDEVIENLLGIGPGFASLPVEHVDGNIQSYYKMKDLLNYLEEQN